jgi:sec-independent protein translocase protein TatA
MGLDNPLHIAFLLILLLLVFGAKRLPEMGRSLGDGMRGFKDALGGHGGTPTVTVAAQPVAQPAPAAQRPLAAYAPQPVVPDAAVQSAPQPLDPDSLAA